MIKPATVEFLCSFVRRRAAIILDAEKSYLIETRLMSVLQKYGFEDLDALVAGLQRGHAHGLEDDIIDAMTTNETYFFRDETPFLALKHKVLPALIKARSKERHLRFWCGAASTGQEPYSVLMVLREDFPELASWNIDFVATDINEKVLARARAGRFKPHEVNRGLSPQLRDKYFRCEGSEWVICEELRHMIKFSRINLIDPWRFPEPFDIVFLRNVLIYFDVPTKQAILKRVRMHMRPDAALFLGGAETTVTIDDAFLGERDGREVYYRLTG